MNFDDAVLQNSPAARGRLLKILQAALEAVDPYVAVRRVLRRDGGTLWVGDRRFELTGVERILVVGAGKASAPMARAVEDALGDRRPGGLVVVKTGHAAPTQTIDIVEASHPIPDEAGLAAGRRILDLAAGAGPRDLVIALLSGGGSALLEAPADLTLDDLRAMTDVLLACGATINEINTLRKHVSLLKGGQLARAVAPAPLVSLVLSDVVGSPLDVIASGPTVADTSTWADAWRVVESYGIQEKLPQAVVRRLQEGLGGRIPDTPKPGAPLFARAETLVVGDNRSAALAACRQAEELGYRALLLSTFVEGEAREVAKLAVALGREVRASGHPLAAPACLVLGGETTVTLGETPGLGGRNQELALAAALLLEGRAGITVAALATDGSDGPTDSAGALADGGTAGRGRALGLDAADHLRRHDAYPFLAAVGDLLRSGPTQTNVNDLIVVMVE